MAEGSGMGFQPMRIAAFQAADGELRKRQGANLPHWTKEGGTYSVTFRLADAVPMHVAEEWKQERERLKRLEEMKLLTDKELFRYRDLLSDRVEQYLDAGRGECLLREFRCASIVDAALQHFHDQRYTLYAWCIMPNHVHAVFQPAAGRALSGILHSWKSYTGNKLNEALGRGGTAWQDEYYDHLVRDQADFDRCCAYVLANPSKAGLNEWPFVGYLRRQDAADTHGLEAHATRQ